MTLVEMMVTIALTLIVLGITGTGMILGLRGSRTDMVRTQNTQNATIVMDRISKPLRMAVKPTADPPAPPFESGGSPATGTGTDVTFYAAINTIAGSTPVGPTRYRFYLNTLTGDLIEQVTPVTVGSDGKYSWPPGTTVTYTVGRGLAKSQTIFTYIDKDNLDLQTLDATNSWDVDSVDLTVKVDAPSTPDVPPTELRNRVGLPNHMLMLPAS